MDAFRRFFLRHFGTDRRKAPRYGITQPVALRVAKDDAEISVAGNELSETGILLQLDFCIQRGTHVSVRVKLQAEDTSDGVFLQGTGSVVRVEKRLNGMYETAVQFDSVKLVDSEGAA